jgi:uncharacterized membrane protein YeaQ/YmgE (transglycosylase-associated protein family)
MGNIIGSIIVGLIVGALARFFYPGPVPMDWIASILVGIGGSFVGGVIAQLLGRRKDGQFRPAGFVGSVIGAMVIILIARSI